jgi:ferric-dicitrate binding protein FerR (iron transport regulator)
VSLGEAVTARATLETASQGRAALRLAIGGSLRLDENTLVRLVSATEVFLERGALYLDSDRDPGGHASVAVSTHEGVVREVGTQFEVQVASGGVRVRVREGQIALERRDGSHEAGAGEQLTIQQNQVSRGRVPPHGPHWDWVQRIAPGFELEGGSLAGFLDWVSRETGRPIRFDDDRLARESTFVTLHGSIEGLSPEEALSAVLPTCGFVHRFSEGAVVVGRARDGSGPKG